VSKSKKDDVVENQQNTEVVAKPTRRRFTAAYKLRIVEEAEACTEHGEVGALLRREGLYSSHLSEWRKLFREAAKQALEPKTRGRKPLPDKELHVELEALKRQNARLEQQLRKAQTIIDVQKKVSELLSIEMASYPTDEPCD
jgi:transposase